MNRKHSRPSLVTAAAAIALMSALVVVSSHTVVAQSSESASLSGLVGTWAVHVTLRDCANPAAPGPSFDSLVTFHRGGTLSESTSSPTFAVGQRSAGHGVWTHEGGRTYRQRMAALIAFHTPANLPGLPGFDPSRPLAPELFAGWQTVTHTIELVDASHLESSGTNAFYKSDGTLYRTGCSTAVARRFE